MSTSVEQAIDENQAEYVRLHDAFVDLLNRENVKTDVAIGLLLNIAARSCAICSTPQDAAMVLASAQATLRTCFEHHQADIAKAVEEGRMKPLKNVPELSQVPRLDS